jgi:hypothetical protein
MTYPAHPEPLALSDIPALIVLVAPILAIYVWGFVRQRRARDAVRAALERDGFSIVRMESRQVRLGPLFWSTRRGHAVYRLVVRDSTGRDRAGWARWGRTWILAPDILELHWDE